MEKTFVESCGVKLEPLDTSEGMDMTSQHLHDLVNSNSDGTNGQKLTYSEGVPKTNHWGDRCIECTAIYVGTLKTEIHEDHNYCIRPIYQGETRDEDAMMKFYNNATDYGYQCDGILSHDVKKEVSDHSLQDNILELTVAHNKTVNDQGNDIMDDGMQIKENKTRHLSTWSTTKRILNNDKYFNESENDVCLKKKFSNETGNRREQNLNRSHHIDVIRGEDKISDIGRPASQALTQPSTVTETSKQITITSEAFADNSNTTGSRSLLPSAPISLIRFLTSQPETFNMKEDKSENTAEESLHRHLAIAITHKDVTPKEMDFDDKDFCCPHCGRTFPKNRKWHFDTHLLTHSDPVSCPICKQVCKNKATYIRHARKHRDPIFTSKKCGKTYEDEQQYSHDEHYHKGTENERKFKCEICDRAFMLKNHLVTHVRIHSTNRSYKCDYCGKTYKMNYSLKKHLKNCPKEKNIFAFIYIPPEVVTKPKLPIQILPKVS